MIDGHFKVLKGVKGSGRFSEHDYLFFDLTDGVLELCMVEWFLLADDFFDANFLFLFFGHGKLDETEFVPGVDCHFFSRSVVVGLDDVEED